MSKKKVSVIHTVASSVPVIAKLFAEIIPEVELVSMLDDSLLNDVIKVGQVTPDITKRFVEYAIIAAENGSGLILNACSSIGETIYTAQKVVKVPIYRIDFAMAEEAVRIGGKIGVLATLPTTVGPTVRLIEKTANEMGTSVSINSHVCTGAFQALSAGREGEHDNTVSGAIEKMAQEVKVIVLAQASMARALPHVKTELNIPVLTSPRSCVTKLKEKLVLLGQVM